MVWMANYQWQRCVCGDHGGVKCRQRASGGVTVLRPRVTKAHRVQLGYLLHEDEHILDRVVVGPDGLLGGDKLPVDCPRRLVPDA